mgnify:FL=1
MLEKKVKFFTSKLCVIEALELFVVEEVDVEIQLRQ